MSTLGEVVGGWLGQAAFPCLPVPLGRVAPSLPLAMQGQGSLGPQCRSSRGPQLSRPSVLPGMGVAPSPSPG